jgi:hypothetical protein
VDKTEFSKQRMEAFEKLKEPLENFVNKWCCPHDTLIVTQGHMELLSGEMAIPLKILD